MTGPGPSRRVPIVAAWVALSLAANGLVFGLADHGIHLPFQRMVLQGDRWQGALLAEAFAHHHSWFWHLQAPFAALLCCSHAAAPGDDSPMATSLYSSFLLRRLRSGMWVGSDRAFLR